MPPSTGRKSPSRPPPWNRGLPQLQPDERALPLLDSGRTSYGASRHPAHCRGNNQKLPATMLPAPCSSNKSPCGYMWKAARIPPPPAARTRQHSPPPDVIFPRQTSREPPLGSCGNSSQGRTSGRHLPSPYFFNFAIASTRLGIVCSFASTSGFRPYSARVAVVTGPILAIRQP